jgi:CRISPR associated protein Cas2.
VQYSVFNGVVPLKDKGALIKEINEMELGEEDKIHVVDLCEACRRKVVIIGEMPDVKEHIVV